MSKIIELEEQKNNIVKKHQDLVHKARYSLSELGIKVVSVLIGMIRVEDTEFTQYAIKVSDFKELIGSNSNKTYEYTHKMIQELLSKSMKIGDEQFAWVSYGKYVEGDNIVVFEMSRHLKPYLIQLREGKFAKYNLQDILKLKSTYVIRLYEMFIDRWNQHKRYNSKSRNYSFELRLDYLRQTFEIPNSYRYDVIKRNIINKAQKQFKDKTNIQFNYKEQKIGRKVDRLIITVKENNQGSNHYLSDKKTFISHMRKNFINKDILKGIYSETKQDYLLSISEGGKLYDKYGNDFDSKKSNEIWEQLYQLALGDKLYCLKSLFD